MDEFCSSATVTGRQHGALVLGFKSVEGARAMVDFSLGKVRLHNLINLELHSMLIGRYGLMRRSRILFPAINMPLCYRL